MTEQRDKYNHFLDLLSKTDILSDQEIHELVSVWADPTNTMVRPHVIGMLQGRLALEQIESIRRFDKASGNLVETTNRLTRWIFGVTILAAVLCAANGVASGWPYLTWWIHHGFEFAH